MCAALMLAYSGIALHAPRELLCCGLETVIVENILCQYRSSSQVGAQNALCSSCQFRASSGPPLNRSLLRQSTCLERSPLSKSLEPRLSHLSLSPFSYPSVIAVLCVRGGLSEMLEILSPKRFASPLF